MQLSKSQRAAILHKDGPMLVLAGPGSGKTFTITKRTKQLIEGGNVMPENILVITFTKAAALEMKQRFLELMDCDYTKVTFGTFHAIFFMVLKVAYNYRSDNIITEEEKYRLMREIISHHQLEYRDENEFIENIFGEISKLKNERIPLEHFYSTLCGESIFRDIYKEYSKTLKANRKIDYDDMLLYTYELFCERKDILAAWQKKYHYILVDECQDMNQIQFEILRMMAAPKNNLFMVGDDDQSIYRFRGSKPEIMLNFTKVFPQAKQVLLDMNYRSDAYVSQAALRLISHNQARFVKKIQSVKPAKNMVLYLCFKGQREENFGILKEIENGLKNGLEYSDFAILFRTNTQPRLLMQQMMEYNIPFKAKDTIPNIYEHWIAKDILAYIRIAQGSRKRTDFLQIMNRPLRYIGRDSLCETEIAFDVWEKMYEEQPWIAERIQRLEFDIKILKKMSPYAAINYIRKGIGYEEYLLEYAKSRSLNLNDLLETLNELQISAKGYSSYEAWNEHIRTYTEEMKNLRQQRNQVSNAVTLATLHSAKGLEFETVFLLDVNEGVVPYKKAVLEQDIEEERRLFYVGMTRAKSKLYICYVETIYDKGMEPSRFIAESQKESAHE